MNLNQIIYRIITTEKTANPQTPSSFGFEVALLASKPQIKHAIENLFGVKVVGIRINHRKSIRIRTGKRRLPGFSAESKTAYVNLLAGQTINIDESKKA